MTSVRHFVALISVVMLLVLASLYSQDTSVATLKAQATRGRAGLPVDIGQPVLGFADLHNHQFSYLGFGGLVVWGAAFSRDGNIATALPWSDWTPANPGEVESAGTGQPITSLVACPQVGLPKCAPTSPVLRGTCRRPPETWCYGVAVHGKGGIEDLVNLGLTLSAGHRVGGYPEFDGWPRWNVNTGQQVYYEWLRRAHAGGLRLMVMLAVNNEALCAASKRVRAFGCQDMRAVDRQIQAAKELEAFVDAHSGGPGWGWYRIAYSAAQARRIVADGKLAVVLGTEVPSLFGCKKHYEARLLPVAPRARRPGSPGTRLVPALCTEASVRRDLQHYYDMGVRHIFPVHNADNGFGGTALYEPLFDFSNKYITGDWFDVGPCPVGSSIDFHLQFSGIGPAYAASIYGKGWPPEPPAGPNCNRRSLTPLGRILVNAMMDKGMVIDVDHTDARTLDAILGLAEARHYPAVTMGHTGFIEMGQENPENTHGYKRHEGNKTPAQLERIRALGGLIGVILHQGSRAEIKQYRRPDGSVPVPFICGNSSEAWAQAYLYAVEKMRGGAVAIGSDFNGLAGMPAPRFGPEKCAGEWGYNIEPHRQMVTYPFPLYGQPGWSMGKMRAGNRVFDINWDGLANVGMYPDFIEELKKDGLSDADLAPLFQSAEAYIRMWELAEASAPESTAPRPHVSAGASGATPATYQGSCPATITFTGTIGVDRGPSIVTYRWIRSDGGIGPVQTIHFSGNGPQSQTVQTTWQLGSTGTAYSGWQAINLLTPTEATSNKASFSIACSPG